MYEIKVPTIEEIKECHKKISSYLYKIPWIQIPAASILEDINDSEIYFKLELFQVTGSFKARGALSVISHLPDSSTKVVAVSRGNHGIAVSYAAKVLAKEALIIMPKSAPLVRSRRVKSCPLKSSLSMISNRDSR